MRTLAVVAASMLTVLGCTSVNPLRDLSGVDRIEIWDLRIQDVHAKAKFITDAGVIASVVSMVQGTGGGWRRGSFTPPSGYLRFRFLKSAQEIAAIGVGPRFLVIWPSQSWYTKNISPEIEANLQYIADLAQNPN
jgi:hypothetical protein